MPTNLDAAIALRLLRHTMPPDELHQAGRIIAETWRKLTPKQRSELAQENLYARIWQAAWSTLQPDRWRLACHILAPDADTAINQYTAAILAIQAEFDITPTLYPNIDLQAIPSTLEPPSFAIYWRTRYEPQPTDNNR